MNIKELFLLCFLKPMYKKCFEVSEIELELLGILQKSMLVFFVCFLVIYFIPTTTTTTFEQSRIFL